MADSIIEYPRRDQSIAYLTSSWSTSTSFSGSVRKCCGVVNLELRLLYTNAETVATGTITVVPVGYRPNVNMPLIAIAKLSGMDAKVGTPVWLYTDGNLPISFSSSRKLEEVTIVGAYSLA